MQCCFHLNCFGVVFFFHDKNYCNYFVIWILKNSSNNIKCASKHRLVNISGQTINHTGSRVLLILFSHQGCLLMARALH